MWALDRNLRHLFVENTNLKVPVIKIHGLRAKENSTLVDPMCKSPGHYYIVAEYQKQLNMNPATI